MATQTTKLVVAPAASHIPALAMDEEELMGVLLSSVYPGAKPASVKLVVNVCRAAGKDPLKKPYHIVPMSVKTGRKKQNGYDETEMRDVIMPGINDYRTDAARTGQHAGTSEPEFGPDVTAKLGEVTITYPQWCKVAVQRRLASGELVTFTAKEFWMENYATQSRDNPAPNAMWKKRPYAQIAKCFDEQTEVLTSNGFQPFHSVTGSVLQVTDNGLEPTDAKPFVQNYDGPMITADGTRLNFSVTPNHDMLTNHGKVEAQSLFDSATKDASKWSIPRTITATREDADIDDNLLRLTGYILADGGHTGHHQFRISVSRPYKVLALDDLNLHHRKSIKRDANRESTSTKRLIKTRFDKQTFTYDFALVSAFMSGDKRIEPNWIMQLSQRQAKIVVDALLEFDGSHNGSVRRLHQANSNVIAAFELLSVQAGYSINKGIIQKSDIGNCRIFTVSDAKSSPVVKGVEDKNSASLRITQNDSGKVWCVTVPTGIIVVRRNGFSMLCGNCSEAQALRKAFPEFGSAATADEMEGKEIDMGAAEVVQSPARGEPTELPPYPPDDFAKNLEPWGAAIAAGKAKPEQIVSRSATRYTLSAEQVAAIYDLAKPKHVDQDGVIDANFVREFDGAQQ